MNLIDVGQVWDVINGLFVTIDSVVFKFIGWLYEIYLLISSARIFQTETFELFINRVYVILGVVMLFFLAYTILKNIADPDSFTKGDSSMGKIISNTVISLVLIAVLPTIFTFLYQAQEILLKENIIGRLILGNYSSATESLELTFEQDVCDKLNTLNGTSQYIVKNGTCSIRWEDKGNSNSVKLAGNSIAVDVYTAFFYPYLTETEYDDKVSEARVEAEALGEDVDSFANSNQYYNADFFYPDWETDNHTLNAKEEYLYTKIASYDACHNMADGYAYGTTASSCAAEMLAYYKSSQMGNDMLPLNFKSVMQYAKTTGDFSGFKLLSNFVYEDKVEYSLLLSTIAGLFICYIMISYCIDMGLRAAKLGFAQLVAPIPILARIVPSQKKMFDSWTKFTLTSYFEVFVRIAIIFLGIFMITHLPNVQDMWENSILTNVSFMSLKAPMIMDINSVSWGTKSIARVAVIIGILMFVKQAPKLITDALGININSGSLNIRNKLKEMVGGEQVVKGLNAIGALPRKGLGALTGGIGSWHAAVLNGQGKVPLSTAFLRGAKQGWKSPKHGYRNAFGDTYSDITGDTKYAPSHITGGNTILSGASKSIDKRYKQAVNKDYVAHLENVRDTFEATDRRFMEAINNQKSGYARTIRNMEQSSAFANYQQAEKERLIKEYKENEGARIAKRIADFEKSADYRAAQANAHNAAASAVRQEAILKGVKLTDDQVQQEASRRESNYLLDELKKMNKDTVNQYLDDRHKQDNKDYELNQKVLNSLDSQAKQNTVESMRRTNSDYNRALDMINNTNAIFDDIRDTVIKDIRSHPATDAERNYIRALDELESKGKVTRKKDFEENLAATLANMGYDKDKK